MSANAKCADKLVINPWLLVVHELLCGRPNTPNARLLIFLLVFAY